jgi:hypothetical protein
MTIPNRSTRDPRGGFFKLYGRLWLDDKEMIEAGDKIQAGYIRVMALANEIDFKTGSFHANGISLSPEFIQEHAKVTDFTFDYLVTMGKLIKKEGRYYVKNWDKYQDKSRLWGNSYRDASNDARSDAPHDALRSKKLRSEEDNNIRLEEVRRTALEANAKTIYQSIPSKESIQEARQRFKRTSNSKYAIKDSIKVKS